MTLTAFENEQALSALTHAHNECLTEINEGACPHHYYGRAIGAARTASLCGLIDAGSSARLIAQARHAYERRLGIEPDKFELRACN